MSSSDKFKCGYCGWIVWHDENGQVSHGCFAKCKELLMDKDRNLFRNDSLGTHLHVGNETDGNNTIEKSTAYEKENIEEHTAQDTEKLDEDLISAVKERPALYDFRIPVKERERKQKDCLWQEVSVCLKGLYTATEAEKRWTYLKDCYRKARNTLKKKQSIVQKSGAAGIPKNYEVKASFRHYNVMTFLNDTLEYRQTVTSLQKSICEEQEASSSNCNSVPSTSTSNNFNVDDVLTSITNNNNSTSLSPVSPKSRKRKRIDLDEYEEAHEDEYNSILESSISTNILPVENEYFKKRMRYIRKVLLINKINEWKRTQLNWHKEMRRRQLVKSFLLHQFKKKKKNKEKNQSKLWVRSIFTEEKRYYQGDSNNLISEMANDDSAKYFEYLRMTKESFNNLLQLLELRITKKHVIRSPISASMRLQICLRYLASGDTMHSISFAFRVGLNTVSKIVAETCEAIWDVLKDKVFPEVREALWIQKAKEFEFLWDFPNCIGAIDGKHMQIQAPPKSGSTFYNYKGTHSIVLMAVADANCCFTIVDIGAEGRRSDGGIFQNSKLRRLLEDKCLNVPKARLISDRGPELLYVIIGDEAFALTSYMLRPYARRNNLNIDKKVFNYRLSRARRTVECAFGISTSRWRILRRPIATNVHNAVSIVKATVCLHNFLMTNDLALPITNRTYSVNMRQRDINRYFQNLQIPLIEDDTFQRGSTVRDLFTEYFCTFGATKQQWEKANRNNF